MNTFPDETLEYWGERFVASGLRVVTTFEAFMQLCPPLRERRMRPPRPRSPGAAAPKPAHARSHAGAPRP